MEYAKILMEFRKMHFHFVAAEPVLKTMALLHKWFLQFIHVYSHDI